ncbi:MAG: pyridoxal phosphate-dependent aminotransferase [Oscillospiraceae bacterium]|nr:pyridoxal phosphate-dependent aminotransferase [Oscillospiraceae bacterium]
MKYYDFDRQINRRGTNSLKYDFAAERGRPADVLPLWVADMDFQAPEPVLNALRKTVEHGVFGYSETKEDYTQIVSSWFRERFGWEARPEWLVKTPGVVFALAMAVRSLTCPGDGVLIQTPVYYPFFSVIQDNGRKVVENRLCYIQGRYTIDFEDFERKIEENRVTLFLLCSPHNPVGRVWTRDELRQMGHICKQYGVYVVSDEIHCDFAFPEHPHHIFPNAVPSMEGRTVVCTAASKSFNLAGLQVSNIWIPNEWIRQRFVREIDKCGYSQLNQLGLVATQAAYTGGSEWLEQCKTYLRHNLDFLRAFLTERIPQIRLVEPEGTYFAWLDCSGLKLSSRELDDLILHRAKLWLDPGAMFGGGAEQFQRVVLACPRKTLETALERLATAVQSLP